MQNACEDGYGPRIPGIGVRGPDQKAKLERSGGINREWFLCCMVYFRCNVILYSRSSFGILFA